MQTPKGGNTKSLEPGSIHVVVMWPPIKMTARITERVSACPVKNKMFKGDRKPLTGYN